MKNSSRINIVGMYEYDMDVENRIRTAIATVQPDLITLPYGGDIEREASERSEKERFGKAYRKTFDNLLSAFGVQPPPKREKPSILLADDIAKELTIKVGYLNTPENVELIYGRETFLGAINEGSTAARYLISDDIDKERLFVDRAYTVQYIDHLIYGEAQEHISGGKKIRTEHRIEHKDDDLKILEDRAAKLVALARTEEKILHLGTIADLYSTVEGGFYDRIIRLNGNRKPKPQRHTLNEFAS